MFPGVITISKSFKFHSAHYLPAGINPKCENIHGHTYQGRLFLKGPISSQGILVEAGALKKAMVGVIGLIDHTLISRFDPEKDPAPEVKEEFALVEPLYKAGNTIYTFNEPSTVENLAPHLAVKFGEVFKNNLDFGAGGTYSLWVELWETPTFCAITEQYEFRIWLGDE